nr:DUF3870 domain-containing protein [Anaeromonas gelatinilytica]
MTGYAKLPDGITAKELYVVVALGLVVDRETSEILEAEPTLSTHVARDFVSKLLVGEKLNDINHIENKFRHNYFGSAKKAVLTAIRTCHKNYKKIHGDLE